MTPPPTTREKTADHAELAAKLKRVKYVREAHDEPYGTYSQPCDADDYGAEAVPVNPDGEAAADALENLLSEIAALRGEIEEVHELAFTTYPANGVSLTWREMFEEQRSRATQAERQRDELRKALDRAADDLRDIGGQSPRPSNSPDPEHENYLRRVLISLAQVGSTRARQALANQGADQ